MTSIVIAGRPNSELTSHCILLGENLKQNFPDIFIIVVLKHPDEWDSYSEELSNLFGFGETLHPFVYKSNGELIGDKEKFFLYVEEKYKFKLQVEDYIVDKLTQENIKKVQSEYSTRKEGLKLIDKIDLKLNDIEFDQETSPLDIGFQVKYERGIKVYYKISEKFNPDIKVITDPEKLFLFSELKKKNILKKEIIEEKKNVAVEENTLDENNTFNNTIYSKDKEGSNTKRDEKDSSFKNEEKKQLNKEMKTDSSLKKEDKKDDLSSKKKEDKKIERTNSINKKDEVKKQEKKDSSTFNKQDKKEENKKDQTGNMHRQSIVSQKSVFPSSKKDVVEEELPSVIEEPEEIKPIYVEIEYFTYNEFPPVSYCIENYEKYIIEKNIGYNFQLLINPFPSFYGEVLVYHKDNKETENQILDYGRIPSLRKLEYTDEYVIKNGQIETAILSSNLKTNIVNFSSLLTDYDLYYLMKSVKEVNGVGFLQILPYGQWNYKKLSSSSIRIVKLPIKDLNNEELPIYEKILQKIKGIKREKIKNCQKRNNIDVEKKKPKIDVLIENDILNDYFKIKDFLVLEEYEFPHLIICFNKDNFHFSYLKCEIERMLTKLKITKSDKGLNFIITKNFMFMCPLINPYTHISNFPIYADPEFYAGIFNLPIVETEWPETANEKYVKFELFDILKTCASDDSIIKEEENVEKTINTDLSMVKERTSNNVLTEKSSSNNTKI